MQVHPFACCVGLSVRGCAALAVLLGGGFGWSESTVMASVWLSGVSLLLLIGH